MTEGAPATLIECDRVLGAAVTHHCSVAPPHDTGDEQT